MLRGWMAAVLVAAALGAQAQDKTTAGSKEKDESAPKSTISVEAKLVVVTAIVRDKHGAIVNDLKKDDFKLSVDGAAQTVKYFDHDTDVPLTVGLLVDTSGSMSSLLDDEAKASQKFLESNLAPSKSGRLPDKAFVMQFSRTAELLQDVTDSRPLLAAGLKELGTEAPGASSSNRDDNSSDNNSGNNNGNGRSDGYYHGHGGTALYDALYLGSKEVIANQSNRRAMILMTDGVDSGSKESIGEAIEAAQRSNVIVYAMYMQGKEQHQDNNYNRGNRGGYPGGRGGYPGGGYPGGGYPGGGYPGGGGGRNPGGNGPTGGGRNNIDGRKVLERICGETGGRMFEVKGKNTVEAIYGQIAEELRSQYRLGFTPGETAASDGYHPIQLTLVGEAEKKKLDVQTREGYYSGTRSKR